MPNYTASGLVLHRINLGETDRILTLYTREHGKLSAVAKGARGAKTRFGGVSELFTFSRLLLGTGKSLDIVSQAEIAESFPAIRTDLDLLARATYLCELLDRFTQERDALNSAELFDLTVSALHLLSHATDAPDVIVHAYELHLLTTLGYAPELDVCVVCGEELPRRTLGFSSALGGVLCPSDRWRAEDALPLSPDTAEILRTLRDTDNETLLTLRPVRKIAAEMDKILRWYLRSRTDREVRSAEFLDQIRAVALSE